MHKVNYLPKHTKICQCGDNTSWAHSGYGDTGSGLMDMVINNLGIKKVGKSVKVSGVNCIIPRA